MCMKYINLEEILCILITEFPLKLFYFMKAKFFLPNGLPIARSLRMSGT